MSHYINQPDRFSGGPDPRELEKRLLELAAAQESIITCEDCGTILDEVAKPLDDRLRHDQNPKSSGVILCVECMIKIADNGGKEVADNTTKSRSLLPPKVPTRAMIESIPPLALPPPISGQSSGSTSGKSSSPFISTPKDKKGRLAFQKPKLQVIIPTDEERLAGERQEDYEWACEMYLWRIIAPAGDRSCRAFRRTPTQARQARQARQAIIPAHVERNQNKTSTQTNYVFDGVRSPKPALVNDAETEEDDEYLHEDTDCTVNLSSAFNRLTQWFQALN